MMPPRSAKRLRIAILGRGLSIYIGGVRRYIEMMATYLPCVDPDADYAIFHNSAKHRGAFSGCAEYYHPSARALWWENFWFPNAMRHWKPDVIFCPKNLVPLNLPRSVMIVTTIHDLLYYRIRGIYLNEYKLQDTICMRLLMPHSIRRSDRLIFISDQTRKDAAELFALNPTKCRTILHGVKTPGPLSQAKQFQSQVRSHYGIEGRFMFYAGSLSPRKNMARVVEALALIASDVPHTLVITAGKSWKDGQFYDAIKKHRMEHRIKLIGSVTDQELEALYRMADLFVFPSLGEGFGLPVLEAMACGCPVLTSTTSSLPEAAGDAAALVDPENTQAIAAMMRLLLLHPDRRDKLRQAGLLRASAMSWEQTARRLSSVFHEA